MYIISGKFLKKYEVFFKFERSDAKELNVNPVSELEEATLFSTKNEAWKQAELLKNHFVMNNTSEYSDITILRVKIVLDDDRSGEN